MRTTVVFFSLFLSFAAACVRSRTSSGPPPLEGRRESPRPLPASPRREAPTNPPRYASDPCVVLEVTGDRRRRVQLNKGADDGLRFGDLLTILREEEPIAVVALVEVEQRYSIGLVELVLSRRKPRVGDLAEPYEG